VAALVGCGAFLMHRHDQVAYDALQSEYAGFKGQVAATGIDAQKAATLQAQTDQKRKDTADADLKAARAAAATNLDGWVRLAKARSSGGYLPPAAPASASPDTACFRRGELESVLGDIDAEGTRIAGKGDSRAVDLGVAQRWAAGQQAIR
jgi:hypothetical protein